MTLADWNNSGLLEHLTKAGFSMTTEAITSYSNLKKIIIIGSVWSLV